MTRRRCQQGLSLVELMIGLAIGLIVTAGVVKAFAAQVTHTQQLLLEARVEQDLRSAVDLIVRDLRRAGYWGQAARPPDAAASNPYQAIDVPSTSEIHYAYSQDDDEDEVASNENHGFLLRDDDTLRAVDGRGGWQPLTDPSVVRVTELSIDLQTRVEPLGHFCVPACAAGDPACPSVQVREIVVRLRAQSASDARVRREASERVRVRNDAVSPAGCP
jgi:prepilin-type N-terminal cleavage/methylation domain-containing protein